MEITDAGGIPALYLDPQPMKLAVVHGAQAAMTRNHIPSPDTLARKLHETWIELRR